MSSAGESDSSHDETRHANGDKELDTKRLYIQKKRFYLDVKENSRGRIIKVTEVGLGGRKARLILSMQTAALFRDKLNEMIEVYRELGEGNVSQFPDALRSIKLSRENKRYFMDLKENNRGVFLKIAQQGFTGQRSQIAIPGEGIAEFNKALSELVFMYSDGKSPVVDEEEEEVKEPLPESKTIRVDEKYFYFDVGKSWRGVFLRLSEVRQDRRSSLFVPEKVWPQFRDALDQLIKERAVQQGSGGNLLSPAPGSTAKNVKPAAGISDTPPRGGLNV